MKTFVEITGLAFGLISAVGVYGWHKGKSNFASDGRLTLSCVSHEQDIFAQFANGKNLPPKSVQQIDVFFLQHYNRKIIKFNLFPHKYPVVCQ